MFGWGDSVGINKISPYWGATTGNLITYLSSVGYECCAASVGPVSSAWDCACELYAQLTGTRVDYGAAHSKKCLHDRFGRKYDKPIIDGFGERKIQQIKLMRNLDPLIMRKKIMFERKKLISLILN